MLIEFCCTNLSEFDAAKGRYVECDELIIASDDNVGKLVKCPKCDQMVEVPFQQGRAESARRTDEQARPSSAKRPVRKKVDLEPDSRLGQVIAKPAESEVAEQNIAPIKTASLFAEDTDDGSSEEGPLTVHDIHRKRCPECGSLLDDHGKCSLCRYVEPQFKSKTASLDDIGVQLAGFQLWISDIMSEGVSFSMIATIGSGLLTVAYALLMALMLLTGHWVWAAVLTGLFFLYCLCVHKAWQLTRSPRARLNFWQRPFWNLLLYSARILNWQKYDKQYAGRKIINLRNAPIVDDKVPYLEDLDKCQVLDLENTLITDKGLLPLYGLTQLQCLVVRRTGVTHEGVFRLQQANPRLWIWD
ncbi:MAG: hypothetical protein MK108_14020 [Mariniblastus sp.]|nr:hypothetical protein [Mariniblastus sp.]